MRVRKPTWGRIGLLCTLVLTLTSGCKDSGPDPALASIPTDSFVDTYVALRITALSQPTGESTEAQRDSVLAALNMRPSAMLEFVNVHGRDATFMQAVWDSVEVRFGARRDALSRGPEAN